ncbi:hypothetical protein [Occallatibacter riparius]|uniref:Uncharacterized protein n=1 Tax=Occallatibacter riparius TaxID=1002689 RepID=A0A9J7BJW7_9BACT|nr:hypothetical protein [Occallatibacter riparius]UWZ83120.1 hypothetical protein MOP44_21430 [Occallatibacter riparius]
MSSTHLALATGMLAVASMLSYAQKAVTFNNLFSSYVGHPDTAYSIDPNNDGGHDIIQDCPDYPGIFLVTMNNSNGTFVGTAL